MKKIFYLLILLCICFIFLLLHSCKMEHKKISSELEIINGIKYRVILDTFVVVSCERHIQKSVMEEINPDFDVVLDNGRTIRSRGYIPAGDTIYTKRLIRQKDE